MKRQNVVSEAHDAYCMEWRTQ